MTQPLTISQAAQNYLHNLAHRNRRPARASSLAAFTGHINRIKPIIGTMPVEQFGNKAMRALVASLVAEELAPKSISDITATVKQIVGSVVDPETGDQIYPRVGILHLWTARKLESRNNRAPPSSRSNGPSNPRPPCTKSFTPCSPAPAFASARP
jgi:hypothetical protein